MPIGNQNQPGIPVSQNMPPVEGMSSIGGMSQEEMRAEIDNMFGKVNQKQTEVQNKLTLDQSKIDASRGKLIRVLFETMQQQGVNPGDPASVQNFLLMLQQRDPDLYTIFEVAFNGLTQQGAAGVAETGMPSMGSSDLLSGMGSMSQPGLAQQPGAMAGVGGGKGLPRRPGKKNTGLLKKYTNLNQQTFRKK